MARSAVSSGPRSAQQPATWPLIATAGTERMPSCFARSATSFFFMSNTVTSQEVQARRVTRSMVSWHIGQPALKTSTLRFAFIKISLQISNSGNTCRTITSRFSLSARPSVPQRSGDQYRHSSVHGDVGVKREFPYQEHSRRRETQPQGAVASASRCPPTQRNQRHKQKRRG